MESSHPNDTATPASTPMDDETQLARLHPNFVWALRVQLLLGLAPLVIAALVAEFMIAELAQAREAMAGAAFVPPAGTLTGIVMLLVMMLVILMPMRRYQARGYQFSSDRLRVVRGVLWHSDIVVPFSRVQHIDVLQGPLDRFFGIATLSLHTAGNFNSAVPLPGLDKALADQMREEIRNHIKRESL
jgi:membrane protein YdbS with pleckstrin-like domain